MAEMTEQSPEQSSGPDVSALQAQLAAAETERQRLAQENQMALGYLQQMTAMVQQQQAQQQPPPPITQSDDDLFVQNPKKFREDVIREATQQAEQIVQQRVAPAAQAFALEQIQANRRSAMQDEEMEFFPKWEKEIYEVIAPAGVDHAINYKTWQQAYAIVAARPHHLDELLEARKKKRRAQGLDDDEDTEVMAEVRDQEPIAPRRVVAPGPISTGSRGTAAHTTTARKPPVLTATEKLYASRAKMTAEEFVHYRDNDSEDIFGFNGRDRI